MIPPENIMANLVDAWQSSDRKRLRSLATDLLSFYFGDECEGELSVKESWKERRLSRSVVYSAYCGERWLPEGALSLEDRREHWKHRFHWDLTIRVESSDEGLLYIEKFSLRG